MKRLFLSALLLCIAASGQTITANNVITNSLTIVAAGAPTPATVTLIQSEPGTATYYYWLVSTNSVGNVLSGPFPITNAPAVLSANANIAAFWKPAAGVVYSLLRTNTTVSPTGACNCAVSVSSQSSYVTDIGSLSAYAVPSLITPSTIGPGPNITPTSIESVNYADQFAGSDMCAKATAAANALPSSGGMVVIPAGNFSCATALAVPELVSLWGQGSQSTVLTFTTGGSEILLSGVSFSGVHNLGVVLPANTVATGIHLTASSPQSCAYDSVSDVDISTNNSPSSLFANQIGILIDGNSCVFNSFKHLTIRAVDQPIVSTGSSEGNIWSDVQMNDFAASNSGAAVLANGNNDQFFGLRCSLGGSTANPIYCMHIEGQGIIAFAMADLGANGVLYTDTSAGGNHAYGTVIGTTSYGGARNNPLYLGPLGTGSSDVNIFDATGANRVLLQAGVAGFSNGFGIAYTDSSPSREMDYTFADGPVGIGVDAAGTGLALDVAGAGKISGSLAWGGGAALQSSGNIALAGANGISAGTITITAGTSGTHTFSTAYGAIPFCTASLESSPPATAISFAIVASVTGVTITSATSITETFSWICTPAAN